MTTEVEVAVDSDDENVVKVVRTPDSKYVLEVPKKETSKEEKESSGLKFHRLNTNEGKSPYDQIEWEFRTAEIKSDTGAEVFKQENVEIPKSWSNTALNIVTSKYFSGAMDTPERETSLRQLVGRVADSITDWGRKDGYFRTEEDASIYNDELTHLLLTQKAAFNSPVWFNVGIEEQPQCSACFINSVVDSMDSILDLAKAEGMLFKHGSGTGTNLSTLRSSRERLSNGGVASGPVSFMRGFDAFAGVIKSGGKTRRAAKMVMLDVSHPDIVDFITSKVKEEKKAHALIDAGYDGSFDGEAYASVFFQNANHSVRVSDLFMRAVEKDEVWHTTAVKHPHAKMDTYQANELMELTAEQAWMCGDPGLQYDDTINRWHTCKTSGKINGSNPCSEYMFLDDSACNLASINLMKYLDSKDRFDVEAFRHAADILITAQDIVVDNSSYPRENIARNSHLFRPLGLGYANLGALLMYNGLPYDSDAGRSYAAAITAILHGQAYSTSARLAAAMGSFNKFNLNETPMMEVISMHRKAVDDINTELAPEYLTSAAKMLWKKTEELGKQHGYRNAQVTVLAPTGTIGLMMDCDTTGVEPDLALVKQKHLSGGGMLRFVNTTVPHALKKLGYSKRQVEEIVKHIDETSTIEGAPHLKEKHISVFDCAFAPTNGIRSINYMGHVRMMAAVQPFLSGAISKTVNMPKDVTAGEINKCYQEAWKMGVKAIAIYREGSKRIQPLNAAGKDAKKASSTLVDVPHNAVRNRLPEERGAITHKFSVGGQEGYITVGLYEDGQPGEIFLVMSKEGSTVSGLMDSFATAISLTLQYGVPVRDLCRKFIHTRFEPSGWTKNKQIPMAKSIMDYIFRWLASKFLPYEEQVEMGLVNLEKPEEAADATTDADPAPIKFLEVQEQSDAPACSECGLIMVRSGSCYKCMNCGTTSGCS